MEIVPFEMRHLEPAARLVADRVRRLRSTLPILSPAFERPSAWAGGLGDLLAELERARDAGLSRDAAVAAVEGEAVLGFLVASLDTDTGRAWCPDWANASVPGGRRVLEAMYARAAGRWVAHEVRTHVVGSLEGFPSEREAWSWLGFGHLVVDAVRDLTPVAAGNDARAWGPATIRRATRDDLETVRDLEDGLRRHLLASPVLLVLAPPGTRDEDLARLDDRAAATFLAEDRTGPIAYLRIGPHADDVTRLLQDGGTAAITAAFTAPGRRGQGVAAALLDAALSWAREHGYQRCGVDFESANLEGSRFWLEHFRPVAVAVVRRLHPKAGQVVG